MQDAAELYTYPIEILHKRRQTIQNTFGNAEENSVAIVLLTRNVGQLTEGFQHGHNEGAKANGTKRRRDGTNEGVVDGGRTKAIGFGRFRPPVSHGTCHRHVDRALKVQMC